MKYIYLIGIPGTGKTTIMKRFMESREWRQERVVDLLDTHVSDNVRVLGKYEENETFSGTDKLSMAVAPKVIEWLNTSPDEIIVGEGDRLNSRAVFETAKKNGELIIVHLTVSAGERERRYDLRGSEQSEKFIQTTTTKCKNVIETFGDQDTLFGVEKGNVVEFAHENPSDTDKIVAFLNEQTSSSLSP